MTLRGVFGVGPLDELLGDIPPQSLLLLENEPGVDAEAFPLQAVHHELAAGGEVVYFVNNRRPTSVIDALNALGLQADAAQRKRFHFIDAFSALQGLREEATYQVQNPQDLALTTLTIERAAMEHPKALFVLDSLSTLFDLVPAAQVIEAFPRLQKALRKFRLAAVLLTKWPYSEDLTPLRKHFDGHVLLRGVQDRIVFSQYFQVERAPAPGPHALGRPLLYRTLKPGGVKVYIPKIVITGPHHAGKTSFIHSAADTAASADFRGTTVGIDHGHVDLEGLTADLFGTPGQERFDPILKSITGESLGVIIMVDSTRPETFPRAREMLQKTWRVGLPAIIAANKQDMPKALKPEQVALGIHGPENIRVVGCVAGDRTSARAVLKQLIDQILIKGVEA